MASEGKAVVDAGGVVIEIMGSNAEQPASLADLTAWTESFGFTTTTMMDAEGLNLAAKGALGPHHHYWVIDLETMVIVADAATPPITPGVTETVTRLEAR